MNIDTIKIQLQKFIVHSKKDAQENPWTIDDLLSSILVYIFPFYPVILKDPQEFKKLTDAFYPYYKSRFFSQSINYDEF